MDKPELLAPAGSLESLEVAVNSGADAVYFGYGQFNARRNAKNFSKEDFRAAAAFCKARGVKMHLTMNTIIYDRERQDMLETLRLACENGVDAIIVQDLGTAYWIHQAAPDMPLHGSTQMTIHNVSGARMLLKMGFTRAVLAREMTREEITEVVKQVPIETEVFVHGALCMCVSGQCYMSSMIGERSGNRGLCAQPCRLPFSSGRGDNGYALSLKDLTLVNRVAELVELGVSSFKIEGRMKRPEYVAAAVKGFREALAGGLPDLDELQAAFSRSGFTQGYFDGQRNGTMFGTRQQEDVLAGQKVLKPLRNEAAKEYPHVAVDCDFRMNTGEPVTLTISDRENHVVTVQGDIPEIAKNRPTDAELVQRGLEKMGGTFYTLGKVHCDIEDGLICPVSQINKLRRDALEQLTALRASISPVGFTMPEIKRSVSHTACGKARFRAQVQSLYQVTPKLLEICEFVAVPLDEVCQRIDDAKNISPSQLMVTLPRLTFGDDQKQLSSKLDRLKELGITHILTGNLGGISLGLEKGFTVHGDFGLNIANTDALEQYKRLGLEDCVLSYELSLARAREIGGELPRGMLVYGYLPLMLVRNCPLKQTGGCKGCRQDGVLTDRKGEQFPVRCTSREYSEILNGKPLYLADRWSEWEKFDFGVLYFTRESPAQIEDVLNEYTKSFSKREGITRGLYYRNVK